MCLWCSASRIQLLIPIQFIRLYLAGNLRVEKEIDRRQLIESGGHIVSMENHLLFIAHGLYISQSRKEGEDRGLLYHDTKNKVVSL